MVKNKQQRNGQIMIEIIIALGVFSLLASALTTLVFSSSAGFWVGDTEAQAAALLRQSVEEIKQTKAGAWNDIVVGTTTIALPQSDVVNMTKTITVSDVCRSGGVIVECPSGVVDVFSKQVIVSISFETRTGRTREMSSNVILTNWDSVDWNQTSWAGGSGAGVYESATRYAYDDSGVTVQGDGSVRLANVPAICQGYTWDFNTLSEYHFDTQTTKVQGGIVSVQSHEDIFSAQKQWDFSVASEYVVSDGVYIQNGIASLNSASGSSSTLALYHFDETSGNIIDSSGNNNNLTVYNTPTYSLPGIFGTSLLFDTSGKKNDYAQILDIAQTGLDGMNQLTIDTWIYLESQPSKTTDIVRKYATAGQRSYALILTKDRSIAWYVVNNNSSVKSKITPNNTIPLNQWVHVAGVYNGSQIQVYINGISQGAAVTHTGPINDGNSPFVLLQNNATTNMNIRIDELRVSNVARWESDFVPPTQMYGDSVIGAQTVHPKESAIASYIEVWSEVRVTSTIMGNATIHLQLSDDDGLTWKYWDGNTWSAAVSLGQSNTLEDLNTHIELFSTTTKKLMPRIVLEGIDGGQVSILEMSVQYRIPSLDTSTLALYHFDETSGNIIDSSGNNNNLTVYNTPTYSLPGIFDTSLLFDTANNNNDYAQILDDAQTGLDGMNQLTIDMWIYVQSELTSSIDIVRKYATAGQRSYLLTMSKERALSWYLFNSALSSKIKITQDGVVPLNQWAHIAFVYDGSWMQIYVNGVSQGAPLKQVGQVLNGNSPFVIFQNSITSNMSLRVDELRVSNIARWSGNFTPFIQAYGAEVIVGDGVASITPNNSFSNQAVSQWYSFSESAQKNSGTVTYQLSSDNGTTWQYWDGTVWTNAIEQTQSNDAQTISDHIWSVPVSSKQIRFRAFLTGDAVLDSVSIDCATLQMEMGDMTISGDGATELVFANRYARPVVFASVYEGDNVSPVVQSVSSTGATFSLQTVSGGGASDTRAQYMVVEEGVWNVQGILLEAKRANAAIVAGYGLNTTTFRQSFESTPIVLVQRMGNNDAGFAVGQTADVTQTNASIGLSGVGESASHGQEAIGWIAVEQNRVATINRSQVQTGGSSASSECGSLPLFTSVDESPLTLSATQSSIGGWSTSCSESTTTTVALRLSGESQSVVPVGYIAFTQPFRYTEALTQSNGYVGRGSLMSSAFPLGGRDAVQIFDMNSTLPTCSPACRTYGYVRVASDTGGVPTGWSDWYGPVTTTEPVLLPNTFNGAAWVQYRVDFFGDGISTPVLRSASINYK